MKKITSMFLVAILYGCGSSVSPVDQGLIDQVMHIGNGSEPQGLDPHIVTGVPEHHLLITMCEGLTISNPMGGANLPGMAESWEISEDGKTYIFNIRKDAKWSNGDDFVADDMVWSWMRVLTPSLGSQYPDMLYYVEGAEDYNTGVITDFSKVGVKALDKKTLLVQLKNPTPFFLGLLSHYSTWPVHKETVLAFGEIDDRQGLWTRPGNFVCNGPMNLKSWELNKKIIVEKNPLYWDAEEVKLNQMHFYPVSDINTEERMFRAKQLHLTGTVPSQKCGIWREEGNPNLRIDPYMGTYYYRANVNVKPLNNAKVRKALTYAIDREKITEKVTQCGQIPAYSFTPPGAAGYNPNTSIPYDPELARQLLSEALIEENIARIEDFPVLQILYNTSEDHRKIALTIQQMWQQNLGINVELENMDWKVYLSRQNSMDYQISRAGWIGDYEDPNTFLDIMRTGRGNNRTGWSNLEFDELVGRANATVDQDERYRLLSEAEKILIDELPIIPVYTYVRSYQLSPDVKGYSPNYLDHHHPKTLFLERD
tara:strand:+ start:7926 stop:9542 length:1617 start_codon:yes stop_codon:yes gene_type:complete